MSGLTRMSLGSTKRFLSERIKTADSILDAAIPEDAPERWKQLKKSEEAIKLLQKSLAKISELEADFEKLCGTIATEDQEQEIKTWSELADGDNGYMDMVGTADEKIAALETKIAEIDHLMFGPSEPMSNPASRATSPTTLVPVTTNGQTATATTNAYAPHTTPRQFAVKPPKMELPEYSGDILKWNEFWTVFKSNIHDRPDLTSIEKFTFLIQKMKGTAKRAIDGLIIDDANYAVAINILHDRFDKQNTRLLSMLYGQLTALPPSGDRVIQKRDTYDECERIFRQIESAGGDLKNNNSLTLAYLSKFPVQFYKELRKDYKVDLQIPLTEARKTVHKYLEELETSYSEVGDLLTAQGNKRRPQQGQAFGGGNGNGPPQPVRRPFTRPNPRFFGRGEQPPNPRFFGRGEQPPNPRFFGRGEQPPNPRYFGRGEQPPSLGSPNSSFGSISRSNLPCYFCDDRHLNSECKRYPSAKSRIARLKDVGRCTRCGFKHDGRYPYPCERPIYCVHCRNNNHFSDICTTRYPVQQKGPQPSTGAGFKGSQTGGEKDRRDKPPGPNLGNSALEPISMPTVSGRRTFISLFQTARVEVVNLATNRRIHLRLCLDSLSNRSYITESSANELKLSHSGVDHLYVSVFGTKNTVSVPTRYVEFGLVQRDGSILRIEANTTKLINASNVLPREWPEEEKQQLEYMKDSGSLADDPFDQDKSIDILIGADYVWDILSCHKLSSVQTPGSEMQYIPTKLGIMLGGRISSESPNGDQSAMALLCISESVSEYSLAALRYDGEIHPTEPDIDAYWKLENMGIKDSPIQSDDELAQEQFDKSVSYKDGRYYVEWTWIPEKRDQLPTNYEVAYRRFKSLTNRLKSDPKLLSDYDQIISLQEQRGIIERVDAGEECENNIHYLPHHPIIKPHRETTKVRIVYDASSKARKDDLSLNECFLRGPVIMPDLCKMLMRFRLKKIAIVADIEKAFLQVGLLPSERDVTRFLWYQDPKHPDCRKIAVYRFCRVVFGIICSPFLLAATIQHHLSKYNTPFSRRLMNEVYVDNIISGADDELEAAQYHGLAKELFAAASMRLQQYCSNSKPFMDLIPEADRVQYTDNKVLGIQWDSHNDDTLRLVYTSGSFWCKPKEHNCKRAILKAVASIFDPLGWFQPVTFKAKLFLQQLWRLKFEWDAKLDQRLLSDWLAIHADVGNIFQIRIPRFIGTATDDSFLAVFCDASKKGYGAVVYLVSRFETNTVSNLIFAKSRLSVVHQGHSSKGVSIPRLELLGAVVGAQISVFCRDAVKSDIKIHLFSDSKCVLYWLKSNTSSLKRFVARRVETILQTKNCDYHYVSTDKNPADFLTKGKTADELRFNDLWWYGPEWVRESMNEWPSTFPIFTDEMRKEAEKETKKCEVFHTFSILESSDNGPLSINLGNVSNFQNLIRITATTLIAIKRLLWSIMPIRIQSRYPRLMQLFLGVSDELPITSDDFEASLQLWIKFHQSLHFAEVMGAISSGRRHPLVSQLGLQLDQNGIIRSHSRLSNAQLPDAALRPILLAPKTRFTELIVKHVHNRNGHVGIAHTLSEIRKRYWIPHGRSCVKSILHGCITCRKYKSSRHYALPSMPPWPVERVARSVPFEHCGIDYFGPIKVKLADTITKMWACLFTCLVTRAVHLEPVCDCSSSEFLHCLQRFFSRRGFPKQIISDNAAQFRLTSVLAQKAWKTVPVDENLLSYSASHGVRWRFITELAPWQGGHYERLVGVVKNVLKLTVGRRFLSWTDFITLLTEAEAIVNSRPITHVGSDVDSLHTVLRPADFLTGLPTSAPTDNQDFSVRDLSEGARLLGSIWKQRKLYLDKLWRLWYDQYLLALRERSSAEHRKRRGATSESPSVGEIVILRDDEIPRGSWKLARVLRILPSGDKQIRSVELKLPNGSTIRRAVNFLVPLEIKADEVHECPQINSPIPASSSSPDLPNAQSIDDEDDFLGFDPVDVQRTVRAYQLLQD